MLQQASAGAIAERQRVMDLKQLQRQRQEDYCKMLDMQVAQRKNVMRAERRMNNYERQINEPAIQAHQNNDFGQLPYKLPGIKKVGEEKVEQYVDRSLNRNSY